MKAARAPPRSSPCPSVPPPPAPCARTGWEGGTAAAHPGAASRSGARGGAAAHPLAPGRPGLGRGCREAERAAERGLGTPGDPLSGCAATAPWAPLGERGGSPGPYQGIWGGVSKVRGWARGGG